jgi:hypothetical protein
MGTGTVTVAIAAAVLTIVAVDFYHPNVKVVG